MCVSTARAEFKGAIALGVEVSTHLHLLGYQNTAQSFDGPNCMLLHVPTASLAAGNLIGTQHVPSFLKDMAAQVPSLRPAAKGLRYGGSRSLGLPKPVVVKYGAFEIVLANSASDIVPALGQVSQAKRPVITGLLSDLAAWYDQQFPSYSFILACFNNSEEVANHPILVQYQPMEPDRLFVPGLESHTGLPPVLGGRGDHFRDFKVVFGSLLATEVGRAYGVRYTDRQLGVLEDLLPHKVVGFHDEMVGTNNDYWAPIDAVRRGVSGRSLFELMPAHANGADYY